MGTSALDKLREADQNLQAATNEMWEGIEQWMSDYVKSECQQYGGALTTVKWAYVLGVSVNTAKAILCGRRAVQMKHVCRMAAYKGEVVGMEVRMRKGVKSA